jgi:hypothetical protein
MPENIPLPASLCGFEEICIGFGGQEEDILLTPLSH